MKKATKKAAAKKATAKKPAAKKKVAKVAKVEQVAKVEVPAGKSPRPGTKRYLVLELLNRKGGATRTEIMNATGWDKNFVDGFIGWTVKKTFGLPIATTKADDGEKTYTVWFDGSEPNETGN